MSPRRGAYNNNVVHTHVGIRQLVTRIGRPKNRTSLCRKRLLRDYTTRTHINTRNFHFDARILDNVFFFEGMERDREKHTILSNEEIENTLKKNLAIIDSET